MIKEHVLRLTGKQLVELQSHLYPGDGLEAVSLALCGRRAGEERHCLSVWKLVHIPHGDCDRRRDRVTWKTDALLPLLEQAERDRLAIVKFHSHPGGYSDFSEFDDTADAELFSTCSAWADADDPHGSIVMLPDGSLFGRASSADELFVAFDQISVCGDRIRYFFASDGHVGDFADRHAQVFGEKTTGILSLIRACVVGCSGTGSPTIEQLFRLGVGEIVGVDPQAVEIPNLSRILNSTRRDAEGQTAKVAVMGRAVLNAGLDTRFTGLDEDLITAEVIKVVAECDVLFGCIDCPFARHVLNKIASTYNIPYFDIGVRLVADGCGGVEHVTGAVHYLQPDGASLLSRRVYTMDDVQSEALRRSDPGEHARRLGEGYISGANVTRPAVIPVNMVFSGLGVFEFLCRIHGIRDEEAAQFDCQRISLIEWFNDHATDGERCPVVTRYAGRGDMDPLLGMPELSEAAEVAK